MPKQKYNFDKNLPAGEQEVDVINPTPHHWPADKPAKKIIRNAEGESQDEDRHNEIRHEIPQKDKE